MRQPGEILGSRAAELGWYYHASVDWVYELSMLDKTKVLLFENKIRQVKSSLQCT
jgi:hypothetical protein